MSEGKNYFKRPGGITEILPVYPENISRHFPSPYNPQVEHYIPFTSSHRDSLFCIRDSIAICDPDDKNIVEGILVFEISPESWTLIYVPTEKLRGFYYVEDDDGTKLNEFDYLWTPIERIHSNFSEYVSAMMQACVDYMNKNPDLSADVIDAIEQTICEFYDSATSDFTVDIYIPPRICDLTGEIYFRPGGKLYNIFDNPHRDVDFEPPRALKEFLHAVIMNDLPAQGLTLSCDLYFPVENRMLKEEQKKAEIREIVSDAIIKLSGKFKPYSYPPRDTHHSGSDTTRTPIPQLMRALNL